MEGFIQIKIKIRIQILKEGLVFHLLQLLLADVGHCGSIGLWKKQFILIECCLQVFLWKEELGPSGFLNLWILILALDSLWGPRYRKHLKNWLCAIWRKVLCRIVMKSKKPYSFILMFWIVKFHTTTAFSHSQRF